MKKNPKRETETETKHSNKQKTNRKQNTSGRFRRPLHAGTFRFPPLLKTQEPQPRRHCFKYKAILNV